MAALLVFLVASPLTANHAAAASMTASERGKALAGLQWISGPASLPIGAPAARFDLESGMMAVTGADAQRAWELLQTGTAPDLQAVVVIKETKTVMFIFVCGTGLCPHG